jgi:quinol monooxygenase YgiN
MIALIGQLLCADEAEAALVRQYLPEHIRLSLAEPGCLSFEVTESDDPMIWDVRESFVDQAAFDLHQIRTQASLWYRMTQRIRREFRIVGSAAG